MTEVILGSCFDSPDDAEVALGDVRFSDDAHYKASGAVVIVLGNSYILVLPEVVECWTVAFKFENKTWNQAEQTFMFTVKFIQTKDLNVLYADDNNWKKPTKDDCEILVKLFYNIGYSIKVPEYNLSADAEPEEEED